MSTRAPLKCAVHPFFEGLPDVSDDGKSFLDELFTLEGHNFCECMMDWPELCTIIINVLFESVQKLEKHMIVDVPPQVLTEVADVTASATTIGVQVGWKDKIIGKIASKTKHINLIKKSKELTKELE